MAQPLSNRTHVRSHVAHYTKDFTSQNKTIEIGNTFSKQQHAFTSSWSPIKTNNFTNFDSSAVNNSRFFTQTQYFLVGFVFTPHRTNFQLVIQQSFQIVHYCFVWRDTRTHTNTLDATQHNTLLHTTTVAAVIAVGEKVRRGVKWGGWQQAMWDSDGGGGNDDDDDATKQHGLSSFSLHL